MFGMYGISAGVKLDAKPPSQVDLTGKTVVVVGGTSGTGRALAKKALEKGAQVTVVGRSCQDEGVAGLQFLKRDLTSMKVAKDLGRELPPGDLTIFTTGIVPKNTREVNGDGIELDMAVSCLSRLVILRELAPRLPQGSRVFVYGMPGNGESASRLDDLNSEKAYEGKFGFTHMNTVAGNEAIVHHLADQQQYKGKVGFYGVNPGLLATNLRDTMHGGNGSFFGRLVEGAIGLFTPSLDKYADNILSTFTAPGLAAHSGVMLGQNGGVIKPNKQIEKPGSGTTWYNAMEALLKSKAGL